MRGRKRGRETSISCFLHMSPTQDPAYNPGMSRDWDWNWPHFGLQATTHFTEPHKPGHRRGTGWCDSFSVPHGYLCVSSLRRPWSQESCQSQLSSFMYRQLTRRGWRDKQVQAELTKNDSDLSTFLSSSIWAAGWLMLFLLTEMAKGKREQAYPLKCFGDSACNTCADIPLTKTTYLADPSGTELNPVHSGRD